MNLVNISQEFDKLPKEQKQAILSIIEQKTENNMKDFLNAIEVLGGQLNRMESKFDARFDATNKEINTRFDTFYKVLAFVGALVGLSLTFFTLFKG